MTKPSEPYDQDQPRGGRSGSRRSGRASGGPEAEGWDDGRSGRRASGRNGGSGRSGGGDSGKGRRPGGSGNKPGDQGPGGLPRWALPVGGAVLVLILLLGIVRACGSDSERSDAGPCLTELLAHFPAGSTTVWGTDLFQARKAGYDESGSLEEVGVSLDATGVIPDPVSTRYRFRQLTTTEQFEARTGLAPGGAVCSLSSPNRSILSGSFDPVVVEGSQAGSDGDLAATEELLAMGGGTVDPKEILDAIDDGGLGGDEAVVTVLERLREDGAYSVIVQRGTEGGPLAAGIGVGGSGDDDRFVPVAWVFEDAEAAKAGRAGVVDKINTALRGTVSIDTTDLALEGPMVVAVIPSREAPSLTDLVDRGFRLVRSQ